MEMQLRRNYVGRLINAKILSQFLLLKLSEVGMNNELVYLLQKF